MSKEWVDIADTAIKIGLGSLITGAFACIGISISGRFAKDKFMLEHKTKLVEQVAENIEEYFSAWNAYIAKIAGITKHRKNNGTEEEELSEAQKDAIYERDQTLVKSWPKRDVAISRLRLMKAKASTDALLDTMPLECELRNKIVFEKKVPFHNDVLAYRKKVNAIQETVHGNLADFYETFSS
ncbi:MAG: hypothetical protein WCH86_03280 [Kiritimatiellales bacterium]